MRLLLICICLLVSTVSNATTVSGAAHDYPNQTIYLKKLINGFTKKWHTFDTIQIDSLGNYSVNIPDDLPLIQFQIELKTYELVVTPNSQIQLDFLHVNGNENQSFPLKTKLVYHKVPAQYPTDTTYWQVTQTIADIQLNVLPRNQNEKHFIQVFDSLKQVYDTLIQTDSYFEQWFTYTYAQSMLLGGESNTHIITTYFNNAPVLPNHPTYVKVAKYTLTNHTHSLFSKLKTEVSTAKKEYKITEALGQIMQTDTVLGSDELQQLGLILYLTSPTATSIFSQQEINAAVTQFEINARYPYQKEIAAWFLLQGTVLKPKTEAPLFCLPNDNFDDDCLANYKKFNVYLGFIHTQSQYCQKDLLVIQAYAKKYRKMKFLLVITDKNPENALGNLPKASNIEYLFLYQQFEILQQYQVKSYPVYFLIDKFGYLIESPSLPPSEMGATFNLLTAPKRRLKSYEY